MIFEFALEVSADAAPAWFSVRILTLTAANQE
jgi:hypothetical protein